MVVTIHYSCFTHADVLQTYGGTNWGNLGYQGGYTSYDYGASITEDRHVWREKYSETKLEAYFLRSSPAYLTAKPGDQTNGTLASVPDIGYTPLVDTMSQTSFYVVRHADFRSTDDTNYRFTLPTSIGNVTLPQASDELLLQGRDAKIFVTDYDVGGVNLIYCTADILTWAKATGSKKVLLVYGQANEPHEMALPKILPNGTAQESTNIQIQQIGNATVINWRVTPERQVITFGDELEVHLLWRNDAFNHWVVELPADAPISNYTSPSKSYAIVKAGYLIRSASISGSELSLIGDLNATTPFELISAPSDVTSLTFNGEKIATTVSDNGRLTAVLDFSPPQVSLPSFSDAEWKYVNSLPEIRPNYDDSTWIECNSPTTPNPRNLTTPTSLYALDYGYHTGSLIYRGRFTANGQESNVFLNVSGGSGFGHTAWLNGTLLGSWTGSNPNASYGQTFNLPANITSGQTYILTLLIDHTGQDEEAPGTDAVKAPRGILDFSLAGHAPTNVVWKVTGNLGGEQYVDIARGPRNEGATFAERQGYHLPNPPSSNWKIRSPISQGLDTAGVGFFTTTFDLAVPDDYDVPMSFVFGNNSAADASGLIKPAYRVQLFVNGWQFGKYGRSPPFPVMCFYVTFPFI